MIDPSNLSIAESVWMPYCQEAPGARLTLFCFHCAGSGASMFRAWRQHIPKDIDLRPIQLPGRENRLKETPYTHIEPLVEDATQALTPHLSRPFAIFGHSMGALVAFEVARKIRSTSRLEPAHLFLSSYPASQLVRSRQAMANLPEDEFLVRAADYHWIPEQLLRNRELTTAIAEILRADVATCESYAYRHDAPFECPVSVFGGQKDPYVSRDELLAWQDHALGPFKLRLFPGDHSYHQESRQRLLSVISAELEQA